MKKRPFSTGCISNGRKVWAPTARNAAYGTTSARYAAQIAVGPNTFTSRRTPMRYGASAPVRASELMLASIFRLTAVARLMLVDPRQKTPADLAPIGAVFVRT